MPEQHLHIVSFNIPYPANYGGVLDVFHKIRWLHESGVKIHLHCFHYGRDKAAELEQYCESVHYYPRRGSWSNFSTFPYIVNSRRNSALLHRLLQKDYPVLFEGLHTCYLIFDEHLNRKKIFRESNIEHHYYQALAQHENSFWKKIYFEIEAKRLQNFEKYLAHANEILTVSEADKNYFQNKFPQNNITNITSFHENDAVMSEAGSGNFILFHGNLAVQENDEAAKFIITKIANQSNYHFKIAGLNPSNDLLQLAALQKNVAIVANPDAATMQHLMTNAHIHLLYTSQQTGLKLKLVNALHQGRFLLVNENMLHGTNAANQCVIAHSADEFVLQIENLMYKNFAENDLENRKDFLKNNFNNEKNVQQLMKIIFE